MTFNLYQLYIKLSSTLLHGKMRRFSLAIKADILLQCKSIVLLAPKGPMVQGVIVTGSPLGGPHEPWLRKTLLTQSGDHD